MNDIYLYKWKLKQITTESNEKLCFINAFVRFAIKNLACESLCRSILTPVSIIRSRKNKTRSYSVANEMNFIFLMTFKSTATMKSVALITKRIFRGTKRLEHEMVFVAGTKKKITWLTQRFTRFTIWLVRANHLIRNPSYRLLWAMKWIRLKRNKLDKIKTN